MRKFIAKFAAFTVVIICALCVWGCSNKAGHDIAGEWKGTDNAGNTESFVFDKTNHATLITGNEVIGGKDLVGKHHDVELKYEVNYNHDPNCLDLVFYEAGTTNEVTRLKGIFRYISNRKIELRMNMKEGGGRFDQFDRYDTENTLVLEKVSD